MYQKTVLDNGIRVVTESHRHTNAVSVGIWLLTGTRDEKESEAGLSHFLEHMVFKGTRHRNAFKIALELEAVGGDLNAFTTQEYTCFHATTLREHLPLQLDVLCDLVTHANFNIRELEREKLVVLQEIAMTTDQPEEYVFDVFYDDVYGKDRLGRPILGNEESVKSFKKSDLINYYNRRYTPQNMVISCAGDVDHEAVVKLVEKYLGRLKRRYDKRPRRKPKFCSFRKVIEKDTEQVQILVGAPAASFKDELRFEAFILNSFLGGGMTSKLYQSIREKRGLAYTVYSQITTFTDCGVMTIYAGTDSRQAKPVLNLIMSEMKKIKSKRISESDLKLFKTQVRGSILLGADDVENRMNSLGVNEMVFGEYRPVKQIVDELERVSTKSLRRYIEEYLSEEQLAVLVMGKVPDTLKLES